MCGAVVDEGNDPLMLNGRRDLYGASRCLACEGVGGDF